MANRKRYRQMERGLTQALIADAAVFVLYLVFAGIGSVALKVVTAIVAIVASGLGLGYLYMSGEFAKRRSRWLVMGFGAIALLVLVSLILKFPAPMPELTTP